MKDDYKKIEKKIKSFLKRRVLRAPITVIVPIYNGEKTIEKCLDSLLGQSQKRIKIICVNDGSTDSTLQILKKYRLRNWKIKIVNQKNQGRAAARNAGLKVVRTKYVMFCDDDDYYDSRMCENMLDVMERYDVDLVMCGMKIDYKTHGEMRESDEKYYKLYFDKVCDIDDRVILNTNGSVCNKIFKMGIIKKNGITFPKGVETAEDFYFCNAYTAVSKTIYYLHQDLYHYIRNDSSIMSDNFSGSKLSMGDLVAARKLFEFYQKNDFLEEHIDLFWRQWIACFWASYRYSDKKYHAKIREEAEGFLEDNYDKYKPKDKELQQWKDDIVKVLKKVKRSKNEI